MWDVYLALVLILLVSVGLFVLATKTAKSLGRTKAYILAGVALLTIIVSEFLLFNSVFLLKMLPFSNLIVLGNWVTPAAFFLSGLAWQLIRGPVWRKLLSIVSLTMVTLYLSYGFLIRSAPTSFDYWVDGVCKQTSQLSCSAACAATLLKHAGIDATEAEMARLCFTSEDGTHLYGLYHGLKTKTAATEWTVEVGKCKLDELRAMTPGAVILWVGLDASGDIDPRYERNWGWIRGMKHQVVLFDFVEGDKIEVGDPAIGREQWHASSLDVLWWGNYVRLVRTENLE